MFYPGLFCLKFRLLQVHLIAMVTPAILVAGSLLVTGLSHYMGMHVH